jgi:hypothetical protein
MVLLEWTVKTLPLLRARSSTICWLYLIEQTNQQGVVDAAEHLLDASVGAPVAHVESFCKGIGIESRSSTPPPFSRA